MDKKKINKDLQDIYKELAYQRAILERITQEIKELKQSLAPKTEYVHPWYKVKKKELIAAGNYTD
jgi:uncharacterized protein YdhG (YjbR/CyaY superfamily)